MKFSKLNRVIHRWGSITALLPIAVIIVSGIILQLKKESSWIQPSTQKGSGRVPTLGFDRVLAVVKSVPEAEVLSWDDIDRLDVRPGKGMLKVRCKNSWEIQVDSHSGEILQIAYRRSDLIESIHDGSFFDDRVKLWVFLPTAVVLAVLWGTGLYLFLLPHLAKRKRKRALTRNAAENGNA